MKTKLDFHWLVWALLSLLLSACGNPYDTSSPDAPELTVSIPAFEQPARAQRVALAVAPAYIDSIAIAVLDPNGAAIGTGIIPVSGGELTFKVPVGVALTVKGAARDRSGGNRFEGETQVPPLRIGAKTGVTLSLEALNPLGVAADAGFDPNAIFVNENSNIVIVVPVNAKPDQTIHFRISGGADGALFSIDTLKGELSFQNPPSYYAPSDSNQDNIYEVQVEVTDEFETIAQDLKITVLRNGSTAKLGGTVSGLLGSGLVLQNNGGDDLAISSNGRGNVPFNFSTDIPAGTPYLVTVSAAPTNPSQTCVVTNGSGTGTGTNITSVAVTCETNSYTVGGTVAGLSGFGNSVVLQLNNGGTLAITGNGAFAFPVQVLSGSSYQVTVATQPGNPSQTCAVTRGSGTVGGGNVTNIAVGCATNAYTIGGTVAGLANGTTVVLQNNSGNNLAISANGTFTFSAPVNSGDTFNVTVGTQPSNPAQTCVVQSGAGTVGAEKVTNVQVNCTTDTFTIGGTVNGLIGSGLVLRNNGGDDLAVAADGTFTFATKIPSGGSYAVTVFANPSSPAQTCTVSGAGGTVTNANIATVAISCTTNRYTIGGTVSGLAGTGLVLQNNAGDNLSITADGPFQFATSVESGRPYSITVRTHPTARSQTCTIINGNNTVGSSNVTNVAVNCSTNSYNISGTINGLAGSGLVLRNDTTPISFTGATFSFAALSGSTYAINVGTQPSLPTQTCTVVAGSGTVGAADVTNVVVNCSTNNYTVSGTIAGLSGSGLVLLNNGSPIASTGTAFSTGPLPSGTSYVITIGTQPTNPSQVCSVSNGSGVLASAAVTDVQITCSTQTFTVGGTVSGLEGTGLTLQTNGQSLEFSANGSFTFAQPIASGANYDVTVTAQPANPSQTCTVTNGSGTIGGAPVTAVVVTCTTNTFTIGGTVSGLAGAGLVLRNNGGDSLSINSNGAFEFAGKVASNASYNVTVFAQPSSPTQNCTVTNGSSTVAGAHVTNIVVACSIVSFSVGGTVTGLDGSGLVLNNNGGNALTISANGSFTFTNKVPSGGGYSVTVATQPSNKTQVCNVVGGSGSVTNADIASVRINCTTSSFTVSGSVAGLSGSGLVLQLNGANNLSISPGATTFGFTTPVPSGNTYVVTVLTQPSNPTQVCSVPNGSGTVGGGNVTDVRVSCVTQTYSVGGTVSGLNGTGLVLRNNGGDDLAINANGNFTFPMRIASGGTYAATVIGQPSNVTQTCTVTSGSGTVSNSDVTTIRVNCVTNTYAVRVNVSGMNPLSASSGAPGNLVLQNNGGNNLTLNTNGLFTFTTAVASGTPYGVTVFTQPSYPAQTCTVQAPSSGTIVNAPVTVNVNCTTNLYTVGGTVSGLSGSGFVLRNGTTPVALSGSTFSISLPSAASYSFNVGTQPTNPSQTCVVSANGSGTVASNNVGDISVTCTTNVYPIGGNVTGLQPGTSFTLTKNGTQQIVISANGMYEFAQGLLSGTTYGVVITKKALGQTCTVTNGSGTVTTGPITNVNVDCVVSNIPRFAFVLHSGDDSLATFAIDAQTGGAKYISKAKTGPAPTSVAVNPDARAVYVTNQKDGTVSQFRVGVSGNLTELTAPEKAGSLPASIVVEPWYRFAYVIGYGGTVSQFSIGTKGDLTPIGSPISTGGTAAIDGAVDPDGRYLYVVNRNNANVAQFRINTNGTLSTIAAPVAAGTAPQRVVVDGSGRYVYVANDTTRDISAYVIGANGALTSLDCSAFKGVACAADPTNFAAAQNPLALAADPAGTYLYLNTNLSSTATGEGVGVIYRYTIGTSGELVGSAFGLTGNSNTSLAVDPSGRYAYVGNQYSDDIYQIKLTPAAAAPTVLPAINPNFVATQDSPVAIAIYSGSAAVEPMAKIVYASNYGTSAIAQYAAAPDGRLSALTPATTGATTPAGIAIDPTGRFAYSVRLETGGKVPGAVSQFAIDANGLLSPITGAVSPSTGLLAYFIGMHPSGRYAYVPDSGSNTISQFTIGENGVLAPLGTAKAATGSGPIGIAVHPSGRYVYVTNSTPGQAAPVTSVGQYLVSAQDGSLSNIGAGAVTAGDRATGIAVTPDGRFAYVTNYNSTNSQIYQFSIGSDGSLSPLAVASVASGANPYAIAVDPTGSYVYAVNVGADGTISQYRIGADGGLVPMTPLTVSVGAYPTGITVDATGTYVYITGYGAGFTNPFVGQLQITTDGSLAPLSPSSVTTGSLPISVTTTATYQ